MQDRTFTRTQAPHSGENEAKESARPRILQQNFPTPIFFNLFLFYFFAHPWVLFFWWAPTTVFQNFQDSQKKPASFFVHFIFLGGPVFFSFLGKPTYICREEVSQVFFGVFQRIMVYPWFGNNLIRLPFLRRGCLVWFSPLEFCLFCVPPVVPTFVGKCPVSALCNIRLHFVATCSMRVPLAWLCHQKRVCMCVP